MVFGNRGDDSGTGVLFTRNPSTGEPALFGDVLFNAQGEDVVAGNHADRTDRGARRPAAGASPRELAGGRAARAPRRAICATSSSRSRRARSGCCRFASASGARRRPCASRSTWPRTNFPLTREQAVRARRCRSWSTRRDVAPGAAARRPLTTGLAASPGMATGPIARPRGGPGSAEAGTSAILVRAETSPDDVHGMARPPGS